MVPDLGSGLLVLKCKIDLFWLNAGISKLQVKAVAYFHSKDWHAPTNNILLSSNAVEIIVSVKEPKRSKKEMTNCRFPLALSGMVLFSLLSHAATGYSVGKPVRSF